MAWTPVFLLPNLALNDPLGGRHLAMVPQSDPRVVAFAKEHPVFEKFASSFTDSFGVPLKPTVLLVRDRAPKTIRTAEAIAGFRDAVVACVVPPSRARWMTSATTHRGAHYSDAFEFHPWSVGRDNSYLVSQTLAQLAMHRVDKFAGQSDPHLSVSTLSAYDVDAPLFSALLDRWEARFKGRSPKREDVALFRSLGVANQAMRITGGVAVQMYDLGRLTALWTSAFETLMHSGGAAKVGERDVRGNLEAIKWDRRDLRASIYQLTAGRVPMKANGKVIRVSLPSLIYFQLSDARNAFTHGNDVSPKALFMRPKGQSLENLATLLFRMAVADHIGLTTNEPAPPTSDLERWGEWYQRQSDISSAQSTIEDALCIARIPPGRDGDVRAAVKAKIKSKYKRPRSAT